MDGFYHRGNYPVILFTRILPHKTENPEPYEGALDTKCRVCKSTPGILMDERLGTMKTRELDREKNHFHLDLT